MDGSSRIALPSILASHFSYYCFAPYIVLGAIAASLAACGGGSDAPSPTYSIGGRLAGLAGVGLVLQNNGADDLTPTGDGTFAFQIALGSGKAYSVSVKTQPLHPSQTCVVATADGTVANAAVTNVGVTCTTNSFSLGGSVTGLSGPGLVLQTGGGAGLPITADGSFVFPAMVLSGASYAVTVDTQPVSQTCSITNGSGVVDASAVSDISVQCSLMPIALLAGQLGGIGNLDGLGADARFSQPLGLTIDHAGNLYVSDIDARMIRKISPTGQVTTLAGQWHVTGIADGTGAAAQFNKPTGLASDSALNLFVSDSENQNIRKITPAGVVTTFAGTALNPGSVDGVGTAAQFAYPYGLVIDHADNIYVADLAGATLRKITPAAVVSTFAGTAFATGRIDGTGAGARFALPYALAIDASDNIYVADRGGAAFPTIRKVSSASVVTTIAGGAGSGSQDGSGTLASFTAPVGVASDQAGDLFVAESSNDQVNLAVNLIRKVTSAGAVTTFAGTPNEIGYLNATGAAARFNSPAGVALAQNGTLYVADSGNHVVRSISPAAVASTFAGATISPGSVDGERAAAQFDRPSGVAVDGSNNIYVTDRGNGTIRKITLGGVVTTLAGTAGIPGTADGTGAAAQFTYLSNPAADTAGNIYVVDGNAIRMISPAGVVTTLTGYSGSAVATDAIGDLYICDAGTDTIKIISSTGAVTSIGGGMQPGAVYHEAPTLAVDRSGNIFIADPTTATVRKIDPSRNITTVAGLAGVTGTTDGVGPGARFTDPCAIAIDGADNLYVGDCGSNTIRKITPGAVVSTIVGIPGSQGVKLGALPGSLNSPTIHTTYGAMSVITDSTVPYGMGIAVVPGTPVRLIVTQSAESSVLIITLP